MRQGGVYVPSNGIHDRQVPQSERPKDDVDSMGGALPPHLRPHVPKASFVKNRFLNVRHTFIKYRDLMRMPLHHLASLVQSRIGVSSCERVPYGMMKCIETSLSRYGASHTLHQTQKNDKFSILSSTHLLDYHTHHDLAALVTKQNGASSTRSPTHSSRVRWKHHRI